MTAVVKRCGKGLESYCLSWNTHKSVPTPVMPLAFPDFSGRSLWKMRVSRKRS